jgi:hypothetical protein
MSKLPLGINELKIMFTLNSQQYVQTGKKLLYIATDHHLKFEDIVKLDEVDFKNKGKIMMTNVKKTGK